MSEIHLLPKACSHRVIGSKESFGSFETLSDPGCDLSAGDQDSAWFVILHYSQVPNFCFASVASCCSPEVSDKHYPDDLNTQKNVTIHLTDPFH
jgi:hypothetical protein